MNIKPFFWEWVLSQNLNEKEVKIKDFKIGIVLPIMYQFLMTYRAKKELINKEELAASLSMTKCRMYFSTTQQRCYAANLFTLDRDVQQKLLEKYELRGKTE